MFAGSFEVVLALEGIEEAGRRSEIGNCEKIQCRNIILVWEDVLPAETEMPAPATTTILRFLWTASNNLSNSRL